jgi:hypothetical protein
MSPEGNLDHRPTTFHIAPYCINIILIRGIFTQTKDFCTSIYFRIRLPKLTTRVRFPSPAPAKSAEILGFFETGAATSSDRDGEWVAKEATESACVSLPDSPGGHSGIETLLSPMFARCAEDKRRVGGALTCPAHRPTRAHPDNQNG